MRAGKIGRLVVRAVIVGTLAFGAWTAATMAAHADFTWEFNPQDGPPVKPRPSTSQPAQPHGK